MPEFNYQSFEDAPSGEVPVRGYLHVPENSLKDGLVLTHGAGSDCRTALLVELAGALCAVGFAVLRCDLPFRQLRPHGPPPRGSAESDQECLRRAVEVMRRKVRGRVYLGGHSYGGRQGSMLAATQPGLVDAILLLSYPLHPPKKLTQLRTTHFPAIQAPSLFVHGTRDGFGSVDEMKAALKLIPARTRLLPVESGGHELMNARNRSSLPSVVAGAFAVFLKMIE
ncbi:MAG: alpha/beta fold hydrolase [Candidatus Acidiferrales bacterium]